MILSLYKEAGGKYVMKKLTTAKIWQFAAGQFGWAMLSGIISNGLCISISQMRPPSARGETVFIPQGLVAAWHFHYYRRNHSLRENF